MNCKSKKIFFCLGSMGRGGAERVVANLANHFVENNDVSIIVTRHDGIGYKLDKRINYISLDKQNDHKKNIVCRTTVRLHRLRNILKKESPDIVISFLPEPSYRLMVAKSFLRIKTIISVRNDPNIEYNNFIKRLLVKVLYTKADGFVFQTPDAKKWFPESIQRKAKVIPNPLNENFLCEPYGGERDDRIVTVGRLTEQKNQKLLLDAFRRFYDSNTKYKLEIYGDGPMKKELQIYIDKLGLRGIVVLMGEVADIKEKIYKAKMFVLTSNYEGMPNALMEAMALGLPCISTDCPIGGPRYLMKDYSNGLLVDVGDVDAVVNSMASLAKKDVNAKKALAISKKFASNFSPKLICGKWDSFVFNLISNDLGEKNDIE